MSKISTVSELPTNGTVYVRPKDRTQSELSLFGKIAACVSGIFSSASNTEQPNLDAKLSIELESNDSQAVTPAPSRLSHLKNGLVGTVRAHPYIVTILVATLASAVFHGLKTVSPNLSKLPPVKDLSPEQSEFEAAKAKWDALPVEPNAPSWQDTNVPVKSLHQEMYELERAKIDAVNQERDFKADLQADLQNFYSAITELTPLTMKEKAVAAISSTREKFTNFVMKAPASQIAPPVISAPEVPTKVDVSPVQPAVVQNGNVTVAPQPKVQPVLRLVKQKVANDLQLMKKLLSEKQKEHVAPFVYPKTSEFGDFDDGSGSSPQVTSRNLDRAFAMAQVAGKTLLTEMKPIIKAPFLRAQAELNEASARGTLWWDPRKVVPYLPEMSAHNAAVAVVALGTLAGARVQGVARQAELDRIVPIVRDRHAMFNALTVVSRGMRLRRDKIDVAAFAAARMAEVAHIRAAAQARRAVAPVIPPANAVVAAAVAPAEIRFNVINLLRAINRYIAQRL